MLSIFFLYNWLFVYFPSVYPSCLFFHLSIHQSCFYLPSVYSSSVYFSICISIRPLSLSIYMHFLMCLSFRLFVPPSICDFFYFCFCVCLSFNLSLCVFVLPSVCFSVHLAFVRVLMSVCLSIVALPSLD
jgi:hypothetical protein